MGFHKSSARLCNTEQITLLCHHFALDNCVCVSLNSDTTFSFYAIMPYLIMLPCFALCYSGFGCTLAFLYCFQFAITAVSLIIIYIILNRITLFPLPALVEHRIEAIYNSGFNAQAGMRKGMSHILWKIIACGYTYIVLFSPLKVFF